ncbi:ATP-binding protein [Streptomyces sp. NPDC055037]|uniref:ATP-binding protein n=1 Tax=unclassified Streptomyces TaxID=2593676 RepID=UPI003695A15B
MRRWEHDGEGSDGIGGPRAHVPPGGQASAPGGGTSPGTAHTEPENLQRPPAEVRYADDLAALRAADDAPRPPGWALSLRAARRFICGDAEAGVSRKFVGDIALVERALVALATNRGLMLVGEPGTAKSLLSELIAAAVSGDSTLVVQGGAATTEEHIKYSWNYALLVSDGPSDRSLVPAPVLRGMRDGALVRFEEITRCPLEVQDTLLSLLSERVVTIPELPGPGGMAFARHGFNIIATANTRDRGVNEMSAALKRRFNFETVLPIADHDTESALVEAEAAALLRRSGVTVTPDPEVMEVLVTTFRDLRSGGEDGSGGGDTMTAVMSTAEAVSVAHAVGVRGWYLRGEPGNAADLVTCLAGTAAKDSPEDLVRLRRYLEQRAVHRVGRAWRQLHAARHLLAG